MQKITIYTQISGQTNITLRLILDQNSNLVPQPMSQLLSSNSATSLYGTALYGTGTYGSSEHVVFTNQLVGSGRSFAFEFSGSDSAAPHRFDDFTIIYSTKSYR